MEADTPGEFLPEDRASSRSRVVPVRCGFSRFRRSIRSASCGVMCARLAAVLARFGRQSLEAAGAVAERPIQQRIDGNRNAFGIGNVVVTGGNLLGAAGEFSAGQSFEHQRALPDRIETGRVFQLWRPCGKLQQDDNQGGAFPPCKCCVGTLRDGARGGQRGATPVRNRKQASPTGGCAVGKTGNGGRRSNRWSEHLQGPGHEVRRRIGMVSAARARQPGGACFENGGSRTGRAGKA